MCSVREAGRAAPALERVLLPGAVWQLAHKDDGDGGCQRQDHRQGKGPIPVTHTAYMSQDTNTDLSCVTILGTYSGARASTLYI